MPVNIAKKIRDIEDELSQDVQHISERSDGAPVVIIVAGSKNANVPRTITGFSNLAEGREARMRDQLGILQASTQIEALQHLLRRQSTVVQRIDEAVKKIADETGVSIDL